MISDKVNIFFLGLSGNNDTILWLHSLLDEPAAIVERQVQGITGKMLSRPWMSNIYAYFKKRKASMQTVMCVISNLKKQIKDSMHILLTTKNFFGNILSAIDIENLLHTSKFKRMETGCLEGIAEGLTATRKYPSTL